MKARFEGTRALSKSVENSRRNKSAHQCLSLRAVSISYCKDVRPRQRKVCQEGCVKKCQGRPSGKKQALIASNIEFASIESSQLSTPIAGHRYSHHNPCHFYFFALQFPVGRIARYLKKGKVGSSAAACATSHVRRDRSIDFK